TRRCSLVLLVEHRPLSSFFIGWRAWRAGRPDMADCSRWQPPRPCEAYRAEWKLCRSARHFLHHYYVHGERPACEQWRRDLASCRDWEERRSAEAQRSLCESERARVQAARKHILVWALRQSPPADWHLPLPQEKDE
uniref:Synaptic plasticity regulator PANTS n=2 Tax=Callithrix jacchus TaxID=9483 RepID=A0A2R8PLT7_CALJA